MSEQVRHEFINERQTSAFRKFKYAQARAAGIHEALASRMRDWKVTAVIGQIARIKKTEYAFVHIDFYTALQKAHIEMWREWPDIKDYSKEENPNIDPDGPEETNA